MMFKKPKLKNKKEIIQKLIPYWKRYWKEFDNFNKKIINIEKEMNKNLDLDIELEFFHVDGYCVGIGASNFSDREIFPLIHDSELGD